MTQTRQQESPLRLHLWSYWRTCRFPALASALAMFWMGSAYAILPDSMPVVVPLTASPILAAIMLTFHREALGIDRRLPVRVDVLLAAEWLALVPAMLWLALWLYLGYGVKGASSVPSASWVVPSIVALGFTGSALVWLSSITGPGSAFAILFVPVWFLIALLLGLGEEGHWLPHVALMIILPALGFWALRIVIQQARYTEPTSLLGAFFSTDESIERPTQRSFRFVPLPDGVEEMDVSAGRITWDRKVEALDVSAGSVTWDPKVEARPAAPPPPFSSQRAAFDWFEWNQLTEIPFIAAAQILAMVLLPPFWSMILGRHIPGSPWNIAFACAATLALFLNINWNAGGAWILRLPCSDWTRTTWYLARFAIVLTVVLAMLPLIQWTLFEEEDLIFIGMQSVFNTIVSTLWSGWISFALGPAIFLTAVATPFFGLPDTLPVTSIGLGIALVTVCVSALIGVWGSNPLRDRNAAACCMAAAILFGGHLLMQHIQLSPRILWIVREGLGTLLVWTLLRHCLHLQLVPPDVIRRLIQALVAGSILACTFALLIGPPVHAAQGISAIYIAFGLIPPLFLPFVLMPLYLRRMRVSALRFRKERSWKR